MSSLHVGDGPSVRDLIERLGHEDRLQRVGAAAGLVRLGRQGVDVCGSLVEALQRGRGVLQKMAALVLGDLAPATRQAVPALVAALGDHDEGLRRRAAVALGQFGSAASQAAEALRAALRDPDEGVRSFAATALALIEGGKREEAA
jgi:HEAT repeat protein